LLPQRGAALAAEGDWHPCASPSRSKKLDGLSDWLSERFCRHAGNADVVRQELSTEKGVNVSLRMVERAVAPLRRELVAVARATVRFETRPGEQLQIDFGERGLEVGGTTVKVSFFVATLGYSRRPHVRAYGHEEQESWFDGMESAFRAFAGVPQEVMPLWDLQPLPPPDPLHALGIRQGHAGRVPSDGGPQQTLRNNEAQVALASDA
jgi:hypothetical protein